MTTRRRFLRNFATLPLALSAGALLPVWPRLSTRAAEVNDYRALVCVFLFGGMDCHDTVLPYDQTSYNRFANLRATLMDAYAGQPGGSTRERARLLPLQANLPGAGSRRFALPPELSALHQLYEQGDAAVVANVGPLLQTVTREEALNGAPTLPPRLFSHNDQQSTWMSFAPEGARFGWGGLIGDAAARAGANVQDVFAQISLGGNNVFLNGEVVTPYQTSTEGALPLYLLDAGREFLPAPVADALRDHFVAAGNGANNLLERDFIDLSRMSLDANDTLRAALLGGPSPATVFPATPLGEQLRVVARIIAVRNTLGAGRQVFFVARGGFDTHSNQAADLPALQRELGDALAAFYAATGELDVADAVTSFTAADFGRTLTANGDGTDHGWGGHHFVVGGAVQGGTIYGEMPVADLEHEHDAGHGRLIPTLSVEQYAAPLARWFGLNEVEVAAALPALAMFAPPPAFI
ncbi:MAG: DUF1501 domain-containing protein [Halioglobus sp.]|nr:DUF1501 domain-containing protein [Halioglobus sp.]